MTHQKDPSEIIRDAPKVAENVVAILLALDECDDMSDEKLIKAVPYPELYEITVRYMKFEGLIDDS